MGENLVKKCLILLCSVLFLVSCGNIGDPISENPIFSNANIAYNAEQNVVEFTVNLSDTFEFPVGMMLPIKDYGYLEIIPSDYLEPAKIILTADLSTTGVAGTLVTKLPNGMNFPRSIGTALIQIKIDDKYYAYISPLTFEYIGFAVLIPSIDDNFPAGFVIGSNFKNKTGEIIGSGVFFGPKKNGNHVEVSGGIFAYANLSTIIDQIHSTKETGVATAQTATNDFSITAKQLKSLDNGGYLK